MSTDTAPLISIVPGIRSGKPIVLGTRITVYDVLSYLAAGMSHEEIIEDFPMLTEEAILACLRYVTDKPGADHSVPVQP